MEKRLEFKNAAGWRNWLAANHDSEKVIWIIFRKGEARNPDFSYDGALEEALCYGWIDSIIKKVDEEIYLRKFTPRTDTEKWSDKNISLVKKLISTGRMTETGRKKISDEILRNKPVKKPALKFDPDIEKLIKSSRKAWDAFTLLAPSYQRRYVGWIQSAKKEETRLKRAKEAIGLLENGDKLDGK